MTRFSLRLLWIGIVLAGLWGAAWAQPAPQPAGPAEPEEVLKATVKEVTGAAQRLVPGEKPQWVPLKTGEQLDELTVIRTGFRTRVVLAFADKSEVVVERATKMGIAQFRQKGKLTKTSLGLKYGSLHATVERARGPSDFTVATPVATLAVTGSHGPLSYCGDIGFNVECRSGKFNVTKGFVSRGLRGNEDTNNDMARSIVLTKILMTPVLGDFFGGLTSLEKMNLLNQGSGRGAIGFTAAGRGAKRVIKQKPPQHLCPPPQGRKEDEGTCGT